MPGTEPGSATAVKRQFRIDEQLHIFFHRTIYPELRRRAVPLSGTFLYTYPVEDPRMFRALYAAFSKGMRPWRSVTGRPYRYVPEHAEVSDGHLIRLRMRDADGRPVMNWLYKMRPDEDREGKHCELYIQFVENYDDEAYQDLQANAIRLLDRLMPQPDPVPVPSAAIEPVAAGAGA